MISVVVPLYNYRRYIVENVESIVNQTYTEWEIVIVDDCSTDDPEVVLQPYLSDRISYIRLDKNVGYGVAKNIGIRASRGEYIVVLDADDMLTPQSLEVRVVTLEKSRRKWIHAKAYEFAGSNLPYNFVYKRRKAIKRLEQMMKIKKFGDLWKSIHAQTVMVQRDVYEKVGLYEPKLRSMGDKEMWARIINNVGLPVYSDKFVAYYRQHSKQMHRSKAKMEKLKKYEKIMNRCIKRYKNGNFEKAEKI